MGQTAKRRASPFLLPIRGESTFTRKRGKKTRQRDTNQPSSSSSAAGHLPKSSEEKSAEDLSPWAIFLPCLGKRTSNPRKPQVRKAILEGGEMAGRRAQTFARRGWVSWGGEGDDWGTPFIIPPCQWFQFRLLPSLFFRSRDF